MDGRVLRRHGGEHRLDDLQLDLVVLLVLARADLEVRRGAGGGRWAAGAGGRQGGGARRRRRRRGKGVWRARGARRRRRRAEGRQARRTVSITTSISPRRAAAWTTLPRT